MKNFLFLSLIVFIAVGTVRAHPLGIFSTNTYSRLTVGTNNISVTYVVDIAEIPSIHEIELIDLNKDGKVDDGEGKIYKEKKLHELGSRLFLTLNQKQLPLRLTGSELLFSNGLGDLTTTRLTANFQTEFPASETAQSIYYVDKNFPEGKGWKEIVAEAGSDVVIENSSVPAKDITNELRTYPAGLLEHPLRVSEAQVQFSKGKSSVSVQSFTGNVVQKTSDGFAELISAKDLGASVMIVSLLIAFVLGAGHALTPGHGKTVVAAYLVGARGTAKHALFLGMTVTATHTFGVFIMGFIALFASHYILPETLFPWLSLISGLVVVSIGFSLALKRFKLAQKGFHSHDENHEPHDHDGHTHTHNGHTHSHLPPGADGTPVTWKNLLALGVSGGLLPCPSAIVVLLSAIALGRVAFGLALIVAFSLGLAGVLTGVGLLMVRARGYFERFNTGGPLFQWLPVVSAIVVTVAGVIISVQAFGQTGIQIPAGIANFTMGGTSAFSILILGFVLGLKHALDADHLVAVSTIVSERKGFLSSSIVGALWGLGHTASLFVVGIIVIALHIQIPDRIAQGMEFAVAIMLVGLGINVLWKLARGGKLHLHIHEHSNHTHIHPHIHANDHSHEIKHSHHSLPSLFTLEHLKNHIGNGKRSIFIGMVHGLAGSAALMLIVLTTIPSRALALSYVVIFGLGSVGGMFLMSTVVGLPFIFTANKSAVLNKLVRGIAGTVSVAFGIFLAWQIGIVNGLFIQQ